MYYKRGGDYMNWNELLTEIYNLFKNMAEVIPDVAKKGMTFVERQVKEKVQEYRIMNSRIYFTGTEAELKIKRYIIDALGGLDNVAFVKRYGKGIMFVFYDFDKVKYYHMKNLNCRVFISKKRESMILIPKEGSIGIEEYIIS